MHVASWRKCDFQLHTSRDPNWKGKRPVGIGDVVDGVTATKEQSDTQRADWAVSFVNFCEKRNLTAIALTDHHEMVMVPYVQEAIAKRRSEQSDFDLWFFPGMELTCRNGVQCIIIFDADLSEDWRREAQAKLGISIAGLKETEGQGPRVTQIDFSYPELAGRLDGEAEIKGRYIILPNVSQGGQHTVVSDASHADFKSMPYVGGYLDGGQTYETLSPKHKRRLSGEKEAWGDRFIYPLPTSDARSSDFAKVGTNSCWIKLAEPTAEGIRQAFLGYRSRITTKNPQTATLNVNSISIKGSAILDDCTINLSAELNSFIGGRGSGKSTLLEYVAFGLGKSCYDIEKTSYSGADRLKALISETLVSTGATLTLGVSQDGAHFEVSRSGANAYQPEILYPDGTKQMLTTKELRSQFPAVVYSQGELSEIGKEAGKKSKLSDLLQFVDTEYKREDERLAAEIEAAQIKVRQAVQNLAAAWSLEAKAKKYSASKASLEQRITALKKTLPELSKEDKKTVARYDGLVDLDGKRQQATTQIATVMEEVTRLWDTARAPVNLTSELPEATKFRSTYADFNTAFAKGIELLGTTLGKHRDDVDAAGNDIGSALEAAKIARDMAMGKLTEHSSVTAQIANLQNELQAILREIAQLSANPLSTDDLFQKLQEEIEILKASVDLKSERTKVWADKIETLSGNRIEAELDAEGNWSNIHDAIDTLVAKVGTKEAIRRQRTDEYLGEGDVWAFLDAMRADALSALRWKTLSQSESGHPPELNAVVRATGATDRSVKQLLDAIDLSRVEAIISAIPKPDIALSYCDDNRKISFEKASEGQRAAALLFMLLEQPGGPLLVDQPEGDLDNKIVSALAEKLHDAKQHRQIMFASHNANIVVNGSSELVLVLDVTNDAKRGVDCGGAIDSTDVCAKITETMEGGPQAFRDRKEKYGY